VPRLIFKKAFGIDWIPVEVTMWFAELSTSVFKTTLQDRVFEFTVGWFGVNRLEKLAIGYFKHSDERESIHKIPTLDVAFDVDLIIPDDLGQTGSLVSSCNLPNQL
jgi:hypothetical protein